MDSILAQLGLNRTAANPADFTAASNIGKQLDAVKSQISSTLNVINTTISGFKLMGVNNSILDTLKSLQTKLQALLTKVASPADLQKEWAHLNSELRSIQQSVATTKYNKMLQGVQESYSTVSKRVKEVESDKNITRELLLEYKTLLNDVSGSIAAVILTDPSKPDSNLPTNENGVFTHYVAPSGITTPENASDRLYDLDTKYDQIQTGTYNWRRLYVKIYKFFFTTFVEIMFYILIVCSMILAGTVCANTYISEKWIGNRIYYFMFGGALFFYLIIPIGIFKTPYWRSYLIPLYENVHAVASDITGGTNTPHVIRESVQDKTGAFTYEPMGATPTPLQESNKKLLRMLCIADTILLYGFGAMYGLTDKILG